MCFLFTLSHKPQRGKISQRKSEGLLFRKKKEDKPREHKKKNCRKLLIIFSVCTGVFVLFSLLCLHRINYVPGTAYCEGVGEYSLTGESESDRAEFFSQFGYEAEEVYKDTVTVPTGGETFDFYNDIQLSQGLDLMPYRGEDAQMYIYRLRNSSEYDNAFGILLVYKGKVVAVHKSSFMVGDGIKPLIS